MKWKFPNKAKVDFTLLRDGDGQTTQDWQVSAYPTSFLVGMKGEFRYVAHGARKWDAPDIVRVIEAMMAGDSNP